MIKKLLISLSICFASFISNASTIKTDVLVIGGGASGVSAAIQSARSKVKTLLVEPNRWLGGSMTLGGTCVLDANRNLPSGIWGEFRKRVTDYYKNRLGYDTTQYAILRFEPYTGAEILRKITDTVKNLTVKLNTPYTTIKKDGTGWDVGIIINGETVTVKAKVLIDATETGDVAAKAGAQFTNEQDNVINEKTVPQHITWLAILKDFGKNADKTIPKPEDYNEALYTYLKSKNLKKLLNDAHIPNDKYMINWASVSTNDMYFANADYRNSAYKRARLQTLGLVYYLQTELGYKNLGLDNQFGTDDQLPNIPYSCTYRPVKGLVRMVTEDITTPYNRESKLYRTAIGIGDAIPEQSSSFPAYAIPMGAVVEKDAENLLVTEKAISATNAVNACLSNPSVQMTLGQGVGAMAAYCAFFKTTTQHLNVRIIQGEILDYKGWLLPFTDIPQSGSYFRAIQQVCATGLLQGVQEKKDNSIEVHFNPDGIVSTDEIKPVLLEMYSRAFLWFNKEKPSTQFTIGNLLSLISDYTLVDSKDLQKNLEKTWTNQYKLPGSFDLNRPITRLEFAVIANKYLNPFAKKVDLRGRVIN